HKINHRWSKQIELLLDRYAPEVIAGTSLGHLRKRPLCVWPEREPVVREGRVKGEEAKPLCRNRIATHGTDCVKRGHRKEIWNPNPGYAVEIEQRNGFRLALNKNAADQPSTQCKENLNRKIAGLRPFKHIAVGEHHC